MSAGNPIVDEIMSKIKKHIKSDTASYNRVYEAFWELVAENEKLKNRILELSMQSAKSA